MLSPLRNRFGIPGVISVIALVFAMLGGAYAASNGSGDQTAEASKRAHKKKSKAKRGPRGKRGPTGPAGPAGPAGPQGPAGAQGAKGDNGANGSNGSNGATGADGQSVTTEEIFAFEECGEREGVRLLSASGENALCNGEKGEQGDEGDPWTAGGSLPTGATQTGTWSFTGTVVEKLSAGTTDYKAKYNPLGAIIPISFPIPLAGTLDESHVIVVHNEEVNGNCPGSALDPQAESGYLCVYESALLVKLSSPFILLPTGEELGAGKSGALLKYTPDANWEVGLNKNGPYGAGTWAVTG